MVPIITPGSVDVIGMARSHGLSRFAVAAAHVRAWVALVRGAWAWGNIGR